MGKKKKKKESVWTIFWDMHSGGGQKLDWDKIYIEAPEEEAVSIFYSKFGRSPNRVTCTCCGPDYSITEYKTLDEATDYHRGGSYGRERLSLEEYIAKDHVKVVYADEIECCERKSHVPEEGYVWQ